MKRAVVILLLLSVAVGVGACGGGGGSQSVTSQTVAKQVMDALFEGRWEDVQNLALPAFSDEVSGHLDAFKAFYERCNLREPQLGQLSRPYGGQATSRQESDREFDVNFQFQCEGADAWRAGVMHLRIVTGEDGLWGLAGATSFIPRW